MKILTNGSRGETAAAEYLQKNKYKIYTTNYRTRFGEIDIIATDKKHVVFIEVKTRKSGQLFKPADSVDYRKRKKLYSTAQSFLAGFKKDLQPRFDIIEVYIDDKDGFKIDRIEHIENAFE